MVAGGHDLFQIFLHLLPVVDVGGGQGGEADDGVHGGPDVVGHVGEEDALCLAGPVGLGQGVLQQALFLHLRPGFLVHAAKADDHAPAGGLVPDGHGLHLEIADFTHADGPVVEVVDAPVLKVPKEVIPGKDPADHVPVVHVDAGLYVVFHMDVQGQIPGEKLLQKPGGTGVGPQGVALAGFQIKVTDQIVVCAQGLDQLLVAALRAELFFLLPLLLGGAVQEEALIEQFSVFLNQLDIAHYVENVPVGVPDPVHHADAVPRVFQGFDGA